MIDLDEHGDLRYLDVALREVIGGAAPPDVRHRVLAATAAQRRAALARASRTARSCPGLLAAAVVILGLGAVVGALCFGGSAGREAPAAPELPQDPLRRPVIVAPATVEEFVEHLQDADRVSVRALFAFDSGQPIPARAGASLEVTDRDRVRALLQPITGPYRTLVPAPGWQWRSQLTVYVENRGMRFTVRTSGTPCLLVAGLDAGYAIDAGTAAHFRAVLTAAERLGRMRSGVVRNRAELLALPAGSEAIVCRGLGDDDLAGIGRYESLRLLDLRGCAGTLRGPGLVHVAKATSLRKILLQHTAIDDRSLALLAALPAIDELDLCFTANVTGTGLAGFAGTASLRRLRLTQCRGLNDEGLRALVAIPSLEDLDLSGPRPGRVTAAGLRHLGRAFSLKALDLEDCALEIPMAPLGMLRHLEVLDLSGTGCDADGWIAFHFIQSANRPADQHPLRHLRLAGCAGVDDGALEIITRYGNLRDLDLTGCHGITDEGALLLARLKKLEKLQAEGGRLKVATFRALEAALPACSITWNLPTQGR